MRSGKASRLRKALIIYTVAPVIISKMFCKLLLPGLYLMSEAKVLIPLRFVLEESELKSYQEIQRTLNLNMDSRCIGKLVLYILRDLVKEMDLTKGIKENEQVVEELIQEMSEVYTCERPESYGITISPNPGVKAIDERGKRIIEIVRSNIERTIKRYVRLRLAPILVRDIKREEELALTLEHAFNAVPVALELLNGPALSVRVSF